MRKIGFRHTDRLGRCACVLGVVVVVVVVVIVILFVTLLYAQDNWHIAAAAAARPLVVCRLSAFTELSNEKINNFSLSQFERYIYADTFLN